VTGPAARTGPGAGPAVLRALHCRATSVPLGTGPSPEAVLRAAAGLDGVVCLTGDWAGGALLSWDPLLVSADPAALGSLPVLADGAAADPDLVGGGWFGWLPYDGPARLAFHDHVLRHRDGQWSFETLWSEQRDAVLQARLDEAIALLGMQVRAREDAFTVGAFDGSDASAHLAAVERAIELIRAGELYQVNVCTRLSAPFRGSAAALFARAVEQLRPRYGAFVDTGEYALASLSPELFLRRRGRDVCTAPIKGTWPGTSADGADRLRASTKDAAENVMIVDLMRNDLGRVCETGSVRPASLLQLQAHPGLWHLVSTVEGRLRAGVADTELLRATFPPGSVTGAPKSAAVRAIADLEKGPRRVYTGAIGFTSSSWGAQFNVAIRTFELADGRIELGVGGGVTADSVPMLEWRECLHKAAPLLGAMGATLRDGVASPSCAPTAAQLAGGVFETLLAIDGAVLRLADHLGRLERSCRELYDGAWPAGIAEQVGAAARGASGRVAVRVHVSPAMAVTVTAVPAGDRPGPSDAHTVAGRTGLWRHKWADRGYLAGHESRGVPLFLAPDGTVLETSRGNLVLVTGDGTLVTPPLRDDLLPGVTRRALLDAAHDRGIATSLRSFGIDELVGSAAFWTSSLSLAVPLASVDGTPLPRRDKEIAVLARALLPSSDPAVR
jgi:para-aminobenzoate synthetase / 4-amino-4-deoxychorismate lyase